MKKTKRKSIRRKKVRTKKRKSRTLKMKGGSRTDDDVDSNGTDEGDSLVTDQNRRAINVFLRGIVERARDSSRVVIPYFIPFHQNVGYPRWMDR